MNCTLMHKRIATAQIELDDESGFIRRVQRILRPEHLRRDRIGNHLDHNFGARSICRSGLR